MRSGEKRRPSFALQSRESGWKGKIAISTECDTVELEFRLSPYPGDYRLTLEDIYAIEERLGRWAKQIHMCFVSIPAEEESDGT